ncbi:modulator of apoptosis 1-like [Ascaphus truei]|uniref:modulator of apoptosis 1-like n=1 Tax=Ascaphus truei TaxID=8439 RepID=UPI003F59AB87
MTLPSRQSVQEWARQMQTPARRVVAVSQVPMALPLETLQMALRQLPGFSKARLVDVLIDQDAKWNTLLVDCRRDLVVLEPSVPQYLQLPNSPPGGSPFVYPLRDIPTDALGEACPISASAHYPASDAGSCRSEFSYPGSSASEEAGLCRDMLQKLNDKVGQLTTPPSLPPLVEALTMATHSQNYRKLKAFSGNLPVPMGEDGIDSWKEHTRGVMEEWSCTDAVKHQRIMECLRPPASTLVSIHREQHPELTARIIVEFLTEAYGVAEDDRALWDKYYAINQKEGEDLSAYIHRVQIALGPLLHHKYVTAAQMDEYLRKQYLRGSSPSHPIANMIRDNLTRGSPPTFMKLLQQVKEHEAHLMLHSPTKQKGFPTPRVRELARRKIILRTNL